MHDDDNEDDGWDDVKYGRTTTVRAQTAARWMLMMRAMGPEIDVDRYVYFEEGCTWGTRLRLEKEEDVRGVQRCEHQSLARATQDQKNRTCQQRL